MSVKRQTRWPRKSLVMRLPCQSSGRCRPLTISQPQYFGLPGFRPCRMRGAPTAWRCSGAGDDVVDALAAGAVGDERLAAAVEVMAPRVPQAAGEDLELQRLGPELPDAAAVQPAHAVRRFDVAVDVDRLVEVQHAVRAPAERVDDVVRVLGAEAGQDDAASRRPCRRRRCRDRCSRSVLLAT